MTGPRHLFAWDLPKKAPARMIVKGMNYDQITITVQ